MLANDRWQHAPRDFGGQRHGYCDRLAGGGRNGIVSLEAAGNILTFTPSLNFFGATSFAYTAADAQGRFTSANVNINVNNVNDAPTDIVINGNPALTAASVAENSANGTVIATLSAVDPDNTPTATNDIFTFTLANNFGGRFQIVGNEIRVQNGALLDFESPVHDYALQVTANDGHGGTRTETVTVHVTDVNEAPVNVALSAATFAETAANRIGDRQSLRRGSGRRRRDLRVGQ